MNNICALKLEGICKSYRQGERDLHILNNASFALHVGERVALVAPSGAGKSTLLHIAGLLEQADKGTIYVDGTAVEHKNDTQRTALRNQYIGYVYQAHHLLPEFSALENVVLPQMIAGVAERQAETRAQELLSLVGLAERGTHRPAQLSGGEQQRVAIARALANKPKLLIADEPTGNLDPDTSHQVYQLLQGLAENQGLALLMATHNHELAKQMDRIVTLSEGRLV